MYDPRVHAATKTELHVLLAVQLSYTVDTALCNVRHYTCSDLVMSTIPVTASPENESCYLAL